MASKSQKFKKIDHKWHRTLKFQFSSLRLRVSPQIKFSVYHVALLSRAQVHNVNLLTHNSLNASRITFTLRLETRPKDFELSVIFSELNPNAHASLMLGYFSQESKLNPRPRPRPKDFGLSGLMIIFYELISRSISNVIFSKTRKILTFTKFYHSGIFCKRF